MKRELKEYIMEVLTKENEHYRLVQLGFISDIENEARLYCRKFPINENETLSDYECRTLPEYYKFKGFDKFCKNNIDNGNFRRMIRHLLNNHLLKLFRHCGRTKTDKFLAPENDTISYFMPERIFEQFFESNLSEFASFENTCELNKFCRQAVSDNFPLKESVIIKEMQSNNSCLWEKFYIKLRYITATYCYKISHISGENNIHEIWSDTCCTANAAVIEGRLQEPVTAKAIMSYAVGIIKNKNMEYLRNKSKQPVNIDAVSYKLTNEDENLFFNKPITIPSNFPSQDFKFSNYIDCTDKESVQGYFIVILYNDKHPLHNLLIEGNENKVKRLFEHYVNGLSYEEIAIRHYGKKDEKELFKQTAQIRQEVKRLKTKLINRYYDLMKEYK